MINREVIRPREKPLVRERRHGGSLWQSCSGWSGDQDCPPPIRGCCSIRARPWCFKDYDDMDARINRDDLDVTADSVLVLQNAGPLGGPGHAGMGHAADSEKAAAAQACAIWCASPMRA